MTSDPAPPAAPQASPAPPASLVAGVDPKLEFALPGGKMLLYGCTTVVVTAAIGSALVWALAPARLPSAAWGGLPALVGIVTGLLVIRPGFPRTVARWAVALFAAQGIGVFAVAIAAVLVYSAARPDPLVFAMVAAGAFTAAAITQASLFSAHLKSLPRQNLG